MADISITSTGSGTFNIVENQIVNGKRRVACPRRPPRGHVRDGRTPDTAAAQRLPVDGARPGTDIRPLAPDGRLAAVDHQALEIDDQALLIDVVLLMIDDQEFHIDDQALMIDVLLLMIDDQEFHIDDQELMIDVLSLRIDDRALRIGSGGPGIAVLRP